MSELPCETCIILALCKAKGPFKRWPELQILWRKCEILFKYLNYRCPNEHLLDSERLYIAIGFFEQKG